MTHQPLRGGLMSPGDGVWYVRVTDLDAQDPFLALKVIETGSLQAQLEVEFDRSPTVAPLQPTFVRVTDLTGITGDAVIAFFRLNYPDYNGRPIEWEFEERPKPLHDEDDS